jgi:hypothetical protein
MQNVENLKQFDAELTQMNARAGQSKDYMDWLQDCPDKEKFDNEIAELKRKVTELEAVFDEEGIKEYLRRVA